MTRKGLYHRGPPSEVSRAWGKSGGFSRGRPEASPETSSHRSAIGFHRKSLNSTQEAQDRNQAGKPNALICIHGPGPSPRAHVAINACHLGDAEKPLRGREIIPGSPAMSTGTFFGCVQAAHAARLEVKASGTWLLRSFEKARWGARGASDRWLALMDSAWGTEANVDLAQVLLFKASEAASVPGGAFARRSFPSVIRIH